MFYLNDAFFSWFKKVQKFKADNNGKIDWIKFEADN